jgi:uncharacterized membrane-anchored protein YitT (DUF2179 family)
MTHAQISNNSLELTISTGDVVLYVASLVMTIGLGLVAGWQVAFVALGASVLGAAVVDVVQALEASGER